MPNNQERFTRIPLASGDDPTQASPSQSRPGIQRATLTLCLGAAGFLLAASGAAVSLYIYKSGLQGLQRAETSVQVGTVSKLANETKTTAAEAKYAEEMNRLQTANESLKTQLVTAQTALAAAERDRAANDAGLKGIELRLTEGTTGDPEFQKALSRAFQQYITPLVDCLSFKPGESPKEFEKRCKGKDFASLFGGAAMGNSATDPFGLLQPPPGLTKDQSQPETRKRIGQVR